MTTSTFERMRLTAPDLNSRRSRLADWLELQALTSDQRRASTTALRSVLRRVSDDRTPADEFDLDADAIGDPEVTDRAADDLEERLSEELEYRQSTIGEAYPFELEAHSGGRSVLLRLKRDWGDVPSGRLIYVFCLLDSGIRDGLISKPTDAKPLIDAIGNVFQICACIAIGGHTGFNVVSFGFPRATGDGFLPALKAAWRNYGSYQIMDAVPYGFDDRLKDGGVDIIAWKPFEDGHAATFLLFVQVASGLDWKDKAVADDVKMLRAWFSGVRFEHFVPAICIPFPLWFDLDEPPVDEVTGAKLPFMKGVRTKFEYRENKFGVIFDRGRIAQACSVVLSPGYSGSNTIEGIERVGEVASWVTDVLGRMNEVRAAA